MRRSHCAFVDAHIQDAVAKGAELLTGGTHDGPFYQVANDTSYGLSSSVMTRDIDTALKFAEQLEAGMVHINDCTLHDEPTAPFGGVKNSGFGRENGRCGIEEMTEVKWITIQSGRRAFPF